MISTFRKNQRVLMLVVAILTIIAFAWLYDPSAGSRNMGPNSVADIYGQSLTQADIDRQVKTYSLALALQQFELIGELGGMNGDENQAVSEFVFNLLVLQHEAKVLGVVPTDSQVADRVKTLPAFQTSGQFDPRKYGSFIQDQLGPKGFSELQLESVIRDALSLGRIKSIVTAAVAVSPAELVEASRVFQKVNAEVLRFPVNSLGTDEVVSDEEVQGFFKRNEQNLFAPESRSFEFVEFAPLAGSENAEGRARIEAQQKQADAATDFVDAVAGSDFAGAASAAGLTVSTSPEFGRDGGTQPGEPPLEEALKPLVASAFLLTGEIPVSDVLQSGDRFYVIKLAKVDPRRALTVEEVRPLATKQIQAFKAAQTNRTEAEATLAAIRKAIAGGQTFAAAVAAAGREVETFTDLDLAAEELTPEQQQVARATMLLNPGGLSGILPTNDGGFAVYLEFRDALTKDDKDQRESELKSGILEGKRHLLFMSWLAAAREKANISVDSPDR